MTATLPVAAIALAAISNGSIVAAMACRSPTISTDVRLPKQNQIYKLYTSILKCGIHYTTFCFKTGDFVNKKNG